MKRINIVITVLFAILLACSCSKDYHHVVPSNSIALLAVEPTELNIPDTMGIGAMGLDLQSTIYGFELPDGTFGLVAHVADQHQVKAWLEQTTGAAPVEKHGHLFAASAEGFVFGLSSDALLAMGPVVPAAQATLRRRMAKLLDSDEAPQSALMEKLATLRGPIALVARSTTLPQKYAAPLLVGAPKGVQADQVLLAATASLSGDCLDVEGELFSPNEHLDQSLKQATSCLRPMVGKASAELADSAVFALYVNVEGEAFMKLLKQEKDLRMMLAGLDTERIRSLDGDAAFVVGADKRLQILSNPMPADTTHAGGQKQPRLLAVVNLQQTGLDFASRWLHGVRRVTYTMK